MLGDFIKTKWPRLVCCVRSCNIGGNVYLKGFISVGTFSTEVSKYKSWFSFIPLIIAEIGLIICCCNKAEAKVNKNIKLPTPFFDSYFDLAFWSKRKIVDRE